MKKIIVLLALLISLCACSQDPGKAVVDSKQRYMDMIEIIEGNDTFLSASKYYDIDVEMAKINDGYRFYVTIDNAQIALYDIEAIAIEDNIDYTSTMAANIGIFEESQYNMIPYQSNPEQGYVKGLVMSGITSSSSTTLYILVQWKSSDLSTQSREIFKLDVAYGA